MSPPRPVVAAWLALLAWQSFWLLLLPPPAGPRSPALAVLAILPLVLPLRGILRARPRALTWGGFISVPYFTVGVMEAWSSPPMRVAAIVQAALALGFVLALLRPLRGRSTG